MGKKDGTKLCKYCKTEIPAAAKVCPNCRKKQGGILKWIIIIVVALIIIAAISSGGDSDKPSDSNPQKVDGNSNENNESTESSSNNEASNIFKVGDVVETSNLRISFLSAGEWTSDNQFLQPKEGYIYYRMEFEFENIGSSDQTISSLLNWNCYADGYSMDQSWVGDDQIDATISSGKKVKGAVYYEVPANAEKIELEYNVNYFTQSKIVFVAK